MSDDPVCFGLALVRGNRRISWTYVLSTSMSAQTPPAVTVAILAQGTSWAVAATQAYFSLWKQSSHMKWIFFS